MPQTKEQRRAAGRRRVEIWIRTPKLAQLDQLAKDSGYTRGELVEVLLEHEAERAREVRP